MSCSDIDVLTFRKHALMDTTGRRVPLRRAGQKWPNPLLDVRPQSHRRRCTHLHTDDEVQATPPYSTQAHSLQKCHMKTVLWLSVKGENIRTHDTRVLLYTISTFVERYIMRVIPPPTVSRKYTVHTLMSYTWPPHPISKTLSYTWSVYTCETYSHSHNSSSSTVITHIV